MRVSGSRGHTTSFPSNWVNSFNTDCIVRIPCVFYSFLRTHLYKEHIWFGMHNEVTNLFIHTCNTTFIFNAYRCTLELFLVGVSMSSLWYSTYNTAGSPHPLGALRVRYFFINWRECAPYSFTSVDLFVASC